MNAPLPGLPGPAQASLMAQVVQEVDRMRLMAGLSPTIQLRGGARILQSAVDRELILDGPAGTGKSLGSLKKLHDFCMFFPGLRCLIVRKTRESVSNSALVTFEEKILGQGNPLMEGPRRTNRQFYQYANGSTITVMGLMTSGRDQIARVMSTDYDLIYVQEATELTEDDWEKLTTRLRNNRLPFQQLMGDCNPDAPTHWIKQRAAKGILRLIPSRHEDNPALFDDRGQVTAFGAGYIATLDALTGVRYQRLRLGLWVAAEGTVYEDWDRSIHLIRPFVIPADWRRFLSIDFGYQNPFVCQFWAINPDGQMILYRELYRTQTLVEDHAKEILRLAQGERFEAVVCDHDAEGRATLEKYLKRRTTPAIKPISRGIQMVQARLRKRGNGRPGIVFFEGSLVGRDRNLEAQKKPLNTVQEFDSYIWAKGQDGKPLKEVPVDEDNHGLDAARYAVAYLDAKRNLQGTAKTVSQFG